MNDLLIDDTSGACHVARTVDFATSHMLKSWNLALPGLEMMTSRGAGSETLTPKTCRWLQALEAVDSKSWCVDPNFRRVTIFN